jgi:hypothetical protein
MTGIFLFPITTAHRLFFNDMQIFQGSVARLPLHSDLAFLLFCLWCSERSGSDQSAASIFGGARLFF